MVVGRRLCGVNDRPRGPAAPNLCLVVARVSDLAGSRQFYERLGLTFSSEKHGRGPEHLSAQVGGIVLELYPRAPGLLTEGLRLGFVVEDLAAVTTSFGTAVTEDHERNGQRVVVVQDPDGHKIELIQALAPTA